ncbi:MAG: pentapeptide repeat-containing protein, partial [Bacteriovoracaceae bacterium]|nr:pentapeptide repeat-containing protein [Bacteriovoracaceae bacterium]
VSGSLFSLTLFKKVTFDSCVFFASKWENCDFSSCEFKNCTLQFSQFMNCNFTGCKFENVIWDVSFVKKSCLADCFVDVKTSYFMMREDNIIRNCFTNRQIDWEDLERTEFIDMKELEMTQIRTAS